MTDVLAIRPCPFCESEHVTLNIAKPGHNYKLAYVSCDVCNTEGPTKCELDADEARWACVLLWNRAKR